VRVPRDVSGEALAKALRHLGYERVRQSGSHIRLTTELGGTHHVTLPNHNPMKLGTLTGILKAVATHHLLSLEDLVKRLEL
jgi:predicted RNA binding protein YcfA (HicA-like mRNA interferase family)